MTHATFRRTFIRYKCPDCGSYNLQFVSDGGVLTYLCPACKSVLGPHALDASEKTVMEWPSTESAPSITPIIP